MNDRYQFVRPLFVALLAFTLIGAAAILAGCASAPKPETARQSLAYADASFAAVVQTASDLRDRGILTTDQRARLTDLIHQGNSALETAHTALAAGDTATVRGKLAVVNSLLDQVRTMIAEAAHE